MTKLTDRMVDALRSVAKNPGDTARALGVPEATLDALRRRGLATTTSQGMLWMHSRPGWRPTLEGMEALGEIDRSSDDTGLVAKARELADTIAGRGLPEGWKIVGGRLPDSRCVWVAVRTADGATARVCVVERDDGSLAAPLIRYSKDKKGADFLVGSLRSLGVRVPF